jgi:hypothetical protein
MEVEVEVEVEVGAEVEAGMGPIMGVGGLWEISMRLTVAEFGVRVRMGSELLFHPLHVAHLRTCLVA